MPETSDAASRSTALLKLGGLLLAVGAIVGWVTFPSARGPTQTMTGQVSSCSVLNRGMTRTIELHLDAPPFAIRYQVEPAQRDALERACQEQARVKIVYSTKSSLAGDMDWVEAIGFVEPEAWILSPEQRDAHRVENQLLGFALASLFALGGAACVVRALYVKRLLSRAAGVTD